MDFVGLPISHGVDIVLKVVDRLTNYCHILSLKHPFTTTIVAHIFPLKKKKL